ncbi:MAG TPA: hypothetical protein VNZ48_18040 [Xanthobacteraceae bacterium]|nr:hypothetical protein [Xanthobacteraceae bacterium]
MPLRAGLPVRIFAVAITMSLMSVSTSVQQDDLTAILKRANELKAAGQYDAALIEAQKLEAGMKARYGIGNAN